MRLIIRLTVVFVSIFIAKGIYGQDFEVSPIRLDFNAEPATSQTKTINVRNHSNRKVAFTVTISDFLITNQGERKYLPPNSFKRSCANWLNINPSFFELNPNDDITIQVGMLVPGEDYGTAWCMVYIQSSVEQTSWSVDKNLGAGITVSGRIGVEINQSPKSNLNQSLKVSNLQDISKPNDTQRRFLVTVENLGDKITKFKLYLLAANITTSEEKQFPTKEYEIFPKMSLNIELDLPNELSAGSYSLAAIADYGSKYPLEGTQIMIEIKGDANSIKTDTISVKLP